MAPQPQSDGHATHLVNPWSVDPSPFYAHVSQALGPANIVATAGQVGRRLDGTISPEKSHEVRDALRNLSRCLEAAGAGVEDILKLTYYKVGHDPRDPWHREPTMEFLGDHRPPTTLIQVAALALPGMNFEIEALAAIPQYRSEKVDVVVVGAGLSGLQAAVSLQRAGVTVKVLEARDRVGGKTWSQPTKTGGVADVGAAWINDSNQSKMYALAKQYGLDVVEQNITGKIVVDDAIGKKRTHPYGQLIGDSNDHHIIADITRVRHLFEETCQRIDIRDPINSALAIQSDLDEITLEQWTQSQNCCEDAVNALTVGTRAMLGIEPSEVSALYFLDYCKSGGGYMQMRSDQKHGRQFLRITQGTQSFSRGLASELAASDIVLRSPVRKIEEDGGVMRVTSARGVFHASRVIVSVPTPLYDEIRFNPPLPQGKVEMAKATRLGDYCKMICYYSTPWWREHDLCGLTQSSHGPIAVTRDTSTADAFSLTCFIVGQPAREWMKRDPMTRQQQVLDQLQKLFGAFTKVQDPIEVVEQIWKSEQWSQGCPCPVMGPGGLTAYSHVLRAPHGRVHFVGTETAYEWKGYMEGAVRSGERGAEEVLQALRKA